MTKAIRFAGVAGFAALMACTETPPLAHCDDAGAADAVCATEILPPREMHTQIGIRLGSDNSTSVRFSFYRPPEAFGLVSVRPYPFSGSVCRVIGESDATRDLLDDSRLLVGCPTVERGAIEDLRDRGARQLRREGSWMLFAVRRR